MKELAEILSSLVRPVFQGIFQVLFGRFGTVSALIGWITVAVQLLLTTEHARGGWIVHAFVFAILIMIQGASSLVAFMIAGGDSFSTRATTNVENRPRVPVATILSACATAFVLSLVLFAVAALCGVVFGTMWLTVCTVGVAGLNAYFIARWARSVGLIR